MDFYTNSTFQVQKGRGLESRDPISKFWDPFITFEQIELQIWYRHRGRTPAYMGHKMTPNWAWPRSPDQFQNFGTLITFERIELSVSNLVQT